MISLRTTHRLLQRLVAIFSVFVLVSVQTAAAAYDPLSTPMYDPTSSDLCAPQSAASPAGGGTPGTIYVIGDSLTVGMRDSGDMDGKLRALGWTPTKINAVGGKLLGWGREQIEADDAIVSGSSNVLVGLGTNNVGDVVTSASSRDRARVDSTVISTGKDSVKTSMQRVVDAIRAGNRPIKIYWTSIYITGILSTEFGNFDMDKAMPVLNEALNEVAAANDITVLPWATSTEAPQLVNDGIHPGGKYPEMATFITNALSGSPPGPSTAAGCVCSTGAANNGTSEENEREVWGFLTTTKGLSDEAAAGLMGSIHDESGFDPHNVQNTANAKGIPDGPEIPINAKDSDGNSFKGRYGYGLIQWTWPTRQEALVVYASQTGRSTGDLYLQLDFLWKELTENYQGTYALLTTPDTTVRQASDEVTLNFITPGSVTQEHGTPESRASTLEARGNQSQVYFDRYSGQSVGYSGGAGCNTAGANIDLESEDTTNIPCGGNTTDAGVADGYYFGKHRKIRLCNVGGTLANSQISGSLEQLLDASSAAGLNISFGAFRSMDTQIGMYTSRCQEQGLTPTPAPYPKASHADYQSCDSIAPPGYSNHQMGLAIDVSCDGVLIPRYFPAASSNPCYQWLAANAAKYGLYEFGKGEGDRTSGAYEAWHWSVDGR